MDMRGTIILLTLRQLLKLQIAGKLWEMESILHGQILQVCTVWISSFLERFMIHTVINHFQVVDVQILAKEGTGNCMIQKSRAKTIMLPDLLTLTGEDLL